MSNEFNSRQARAWNKEIKDGASFYAISPLNGLYSDVTQFRTYKGHLQAKSLRTGKWLGVTFASVRKAVNSTEPSA